MRSVLVAALASCTDGRSKSQTRRFLGGLSRDELQFIAEYLGASILESATEDACSGLGLSERIVEAQRSGSSHPDLDHKTILLMEFLGRSGLRKTPLAPRPTHA